MKFYVFCSDQKEKIEIIIRILNVKLKIAC